MTKSLTQLAPTLNPANIKVLCKAATPNGKLDSKGVKIGDLVRFVCTIPGYFDSVSFLGSMKHMFVDDAGKKITDIHSFMEE